MACLSFSQALIPLPAKISPQRGEFLLSPDSRIEVTRDTRALGEMLRAQLRPATGYALELGRGRHDISLALDRKLAALGPEGYTLNVKPDRIEIRAGQPAGVFYGMQTLRQLLGPQIFRRSQANVAAWRVPAVSIEDSPRFSWRGAMMDVSRHFMPKEFVLKFLDLMALHKLNVFHLHLTDDQGWRVQIRKYPKLTELASGSDLSAERPEVATRSASNRPGGFYTQDDIREIVRYAAARQITVVPEIEMPGHAAAAILAYPELGNRVQIEAAGADAKFLGRDNVYNVDDATIAFLKNVLDEVLEMFPSRFVHVGGDEVWKEPWKRNPAAQARMKALGLKDENELQSWFIRQFDDYLVSKGRRLIGWDEILEGGLAPNAAVMSWRGTDGGVAAAKAGHDVVMAPTSHTYFDYYQSKWRTLEPRAIGGLVTLDTVYGFEPVPPTLTEQEATHIMGAQAQLWTEYIPNPKHMEYMAYPRFCALAEVVWSPKSARNYPEFLNRLGEHLKRLDVLDVNYRPLKEPTPPPTVGGWSSGEFTETWMQHDWDATPLIVAPGRYGFLFQFRDGQCRLDIKDAQLLEDGVPVATDAHEGRTGGDDSKNEYRFNLRAVKPGAKYTLRATVRTDGGTDSNGDIYLVDAPRR